MASLQKLRSRRDVTYVAALRASERAEAQGTQEGRFAALRAWDAHARADRAYREALANASLRPSPFAPISFERLMGE